MCRQLPPEGSAIPDDQVTLLTSTHLVPCAVLEVHQFSRDASVAEAWLLGQEPYLSSREIGQSVDEVEKLIKRHEAFEKSAATWDERFSALERLTTVSSHWMLRYLVCRFSWAASTSCSPPGPGNSHYYCSEELSGTESGETIHNFHPSVISWAPRFMIACNSFPPGSLLV